MEQNKLLRIDPHRTHDNPLRNESFLHAMQEQLVIQGYGGQCILNFKSHAKQLQITCV